jgi:tRNA(fMet)-specific endonuclease VapC
VARASEVCLPLPVLAELRFGFLKGSQSARNEAVLEAFLDNRCVSVICPDEQSALYYAQLRLQLTRQGTPIPTHDLWISALTLQHNLHLCTDDQHFAHLPQLLRARPD